MKTGPRDLNNITSKKLSEVATLRILSIKFLSMRYIKLAQMTPGARISAFYLLRQKLLGVTQICANGGNDGGGGNGA
jgi:hypothetical protein